MSNIYIFMREKLNQKIMNRILVPIDFSDQAKYASKVAASIAKKTNSEIILLHMFDIPPDTIDPASASNLHGGAQNIYYMKGIHREFQKFMALPFFKGIKVIESVRFHKAFEGVIEESKEKNVDLIVMGSHGASGLKEILVGSNTEKVVRLSHIPVLVIKKDIDNFEINDIVFASDFGNESKKTFQNVINYAKMFNAKLHLLFINTIHNFVSTRVLNEKLSSFTNSFEMTNYTVNVYSDSTIEEGILNFTSEIDADMIAINTHRRSGLYHLFSDNIGKDLANHALKPVITFKI